MAPVNTFLFWLLFPAAYILGSVPWGLVFTRMFSSGDIRKQGSGNIGSTNVGRTAGIIPGVLTLVADAAKGAVPVWLAVMTAGTEQGGELFIGLVGLAAFLGHLYSCFLKFKGGKGVATAAGCFLIVAPAAVAAALLVFAGVSLLTKRVSAGSLAAAAALPLGVWYFYHSCGFTACAGIIALFITLSHRKNIRRIIAGREPVFRFKKPDTD